MIRINLGKENKSGVLIYLEKEKFWDFSGRIVGCEFLCTTGNKVILSNLSEIVDLQKKTKNNIRKYSG